MSAPPSPPAPAAATPAEARAAAAAAANACLEADFPAGGDYLFHAATSPAFRKAAAALAARAQALLQRFEGWPPGVGLEDEAEACEALTGVLDVAFDRMDAALDAAAAAARTGRRGEAGGSAAPAPPRAAAPSRYIAGLARPQDAFPTPPDNSPQPFVPPPPFGLSGHQRGSMEHPLGDVIRALRPSGDALVGPSAPVLPPPLLDATPCTLVDTPQALEACAAALLGAEGGAIAVDLEAHSYRSFAGFTCLIQASTRREDFLIDALALRGHIRAALAPVFQAAGVVKVMHGADGDVTWLQRDFGIYVVNLFDTGQAARLLQLPSASLAHLLETLCAFKPDKRFQLADWRLRPLSADMRHYARCDTHFLLHCYDRLRPMLRALPPPAAPADGDAASPAGRFEAPLAFSPWGEAEAFGAEHGALPAAWARSGGVALRLYRREAPPGPDAAALMASRAGAPLGSAALAALSALLSWRDAAARAADESGGYVLSRAVALRLAAAAGGGAAPDARAVAAACGREAPFAAARAAELAHVIATALAAHAAPPPEAPPPQQQQPPQPLALDAAVASEPSAEPEQPPRKRRAIALAAAPAAGGGLGGLLQQGAAAAEAGAGAEAALRVRASFALPP